MYKNPDLPDEELSGMTNDPRSFDYLDHVHIKDLPEMYEMIYKFRAIADEYQRKNGGLRPILMAEAYTNLTEYPKYFKSKDGSKLGAQMPFNFVFISELWGDRTAEDYKTAIDRTIASVPSDTRLNWVMGNHDQPRMGSRYGERRIDGHLMLVMTLPGIAVTYMGEEIGMLDYRDGISYADTVDPKAKNLNETENWRWHSRDPERTPFQWNGSKYAGFMSANVSENVKPWLPVHPNYREVNVALQKKFKRSTLKFYKELVQLRKEDTFAYGSFNSSVINENVFAYVRALNGSATYVVLINFGAREELIDVNTVTEGIDDNLPREMEIATAGADSCYWRGDIVTTKEVLLRKYDAIILKEYHSAVNDNSSSPSIVPNIMVTAGVLLTSTIASFMLQVL